MLLFVLRLPGKDHYPLRGANNERSVYRPFNMRAPDMLSAFSAPRPLLSLHEPLLSENATQNPSSPFKEQYGVKKMGLSPKKQFFKN